MVHVFRQQVFRRGFRRSEVQAGEPRGHQTVHLLGKWLRQVSGAQTGFHVSYRHMLVESRQSRCKCGGSITLHQHQVRTLRMNYRFERRQDARRDLRQGLPRLHQIQVVIGSYFEGGEHLVKHGAVLCSHARAYFEMCALAQFNSTGQSLIASGRVPKTMSIFRNIVRNKWWRGGAKISDLTDEGTRAGFHNAFETSGYRRPPITFFN